MTQSDRTRARRVTLRCQFCLTLNRVDLRRAGARPRCGECDRPFLLDRPVPANDDDLDRLLAEAEVPVLVDFYADWCAPCRLMAPILDEVARQRSGELLIAKVDTDRNPEAVRRFGVRGIPTLILFRGGAEVARQTGSLPREGLEALLDGA